MFRHEVEGEVAGCVLRWKAKIDLDGTVWLFEEDTDAAVVGINPAGELVVRLRAWNDLGFATKGPGEVEPRLRLG